MSDSTRYVGEMWSSRAVPTTRSIHTYSCICKLTSDRRGVLRILPAVRTPEANLGECDTQHFLICVRRSSYGYGERNVEVCLILNLNLGEEQAGDEAGTHILGIRDEKTRMKVTPPLAVVSGGSAHCAGL